MKVVRVVQNLACVAVVSVSFKPSGASARARALGKKEQKSRSGGEGLKETETAATQAIQNFKFLICEI